MSASGGERRRSGSSRRSLRRRVGPVLRIENIDDRKPQGQTVDHLLPLFRELPDARLCLDVAHARQVDPTGCR